MSSLKSTINKISLGPIITSVSQRWLTDLSLTLSDQYDGHAVHSSVSMNFCTYEEEVGLFSRYSYLDRLALNVSSPHRFAKDDSRCRHDVSVFSRQLRTITTGSEEIVGGLTVHERRALAPSKELDTYPKSQRSRSVGTVPRA